MAQAKFSKLTQADIKKVPKRLSDEISDSKRPVRLLSRQEVVDRVGVTFPTIWDWMRRGMFPRSRQLGDGGRSAWVESEIEDWIAALPVRRLKGEHKGKAA